MPSLAACRCLFRLMYSNGPPHIAGQKQDDIQQLCEDTGCSPEDLPEAMNDRKKWRERVWDIRACGTTMMMTTLSLACNALGMVINFLVLWFICLSSSKMVTNIS